MSTAGWSNRIIGHGNEPPDQLLANPNNWRIHPRAQQEALTTLLDTVGWVQDVIVNQRTGHVVDGHMRVAVAISRNEATIPVVYVDLSAEEEALVLASLDPLAAMAVTDKKMIADLISGLAVPEGALNGLLAGMVDEKALAQLGEYVGMPEFTRDDAGSWRSVVMHFKTQADMEAFAGLIGQSWTSKTRAAWYPEVENVTAANVRYADAAADKS